MNKFRLMFGVLIKGLLAITSFTSPGMAFAEELVLAAAPRESYEEGQALYGPVASYLSQLLGKPVVYSHTNHWIRYQSDIKKGKYDFVLDGPHLASWRIKNISHRPLVKLPGLLQFHFVARADDRDINKPEDLIYKQVCVIPPPNLTAVTLLQRLHDPVKEPVLVSVNGGMQDMVDKLLQGGCDATVVRTSFYDKQLSADHKARVKILYTSEKLPNQAITVSNRISDAEYEKLVAGLTSEQGKKALEPLVKRFGGKDSTGFMPVEKNEYNGYSKFLEGVVLGW